MFRRWDSTTMKDFTIGGREGGEGPNTIEGYRQWMRNLMAGRGGELYTSYGIASGPVNSEIFDAG